MVTRSLPLPFSSSSPENQCTICFSMINTLKHSLRNC
ncbi:unnamed protein product [Lathyrus oleraceus]